MNISEPDPVPPSLPLGYATPAARSGGSPTRAATVIALVGLALIVLGGCFLIGVMLALPPASPPPTFLMVILYSMAFTCFAVAAFCLYVGLKRLIQLASRD